MLHLIRDGLPIQDDAAACPDQVCLFRETRYTCETMGIELNKPLVPKISLIVNRCTGGHGTESITRVSLEYFFLVGLMGAGFTDFCWSCWGYFFIL